jgi:hypothetical protein
MKPAAPHSASTQKTGSRLGPAAILLAALGAYLIWFDRDEENAWVYGLLVGVPGLAAMVCGIAGVWTSRASRAGLAIAVMGLVLGAAVTLASLRPAWDQAHESSWQSTSKDMVGRLAPPFSMMAPDGTPVTDAGLRGSAYVLDFWTTQEVLPRLDAFRVKYKDAGLKVFAVAPESDWQTAVSLSKTRNLQTPVLRDGDTSGAWTAFNASVYPETIVVGRDGKIVGVLFDNQYGQALEDLVQAALKP